MHCVIPPVALFPSNIPTICTHIYGEMEPGIHVPPTENTGSCSDFYSTAYMARRKHLSHHTPCAETRSCCLGTITHPMTGAYIIYRLIGMSHLFARNLMPGTCRGIYLIQSRNLLCAALAGELCMQPFLLSSQHFSISSRPCFPCRGLAKHPSIPEPLSSSRKKKPKSLVGKTIEKTGVSSGQILLGANLPAFRRNTNRDMR